MGIGFSIVGWILMAAGLIGLILTMVVLTPVVGAPSPRRPRLLSWASSTRSSDTSAS
jgi:uncharacterized membrane protein YbaN (DUF454 family)